MSRLGVDGPGPGFCRRNGQVGIDEDRLTQDEVKGVELGLIKSRSNDIMQRVVVVVNHASTVNEAHAGDGDHARVKLSFDHDADLAHGCRRSQAPKNGEVGNVA